MSEEISAETVKKFLDEVIEIESRSTFQQGAQKTARQDKIKNALDKFTNTGGDDVSEKNKPE